MGMSHAKAVAAGKKAARTRRLNAGKRGPRKPKRSTGKKKKGKMPENVKRYFKLINQGVSKSKAKTMCGMA